MTVEWVKLGDREYKRSQDYPGYVKVPKDLEEEKKAIAMREKFKAEDQKKYPMPIDEKTGKPMRTAEEYLLMKMEEHRKNNPHLPEPEPEPEFDPDEVDWPELQQACVCNDLPHVKRLIAIGADVNEIGPDTACSLLVACQKGNREMTEALLAAGAWPDYSTGHLLKWWGWRPGSDGRCISAYNRHLEKKALEEDAKASRSN